MDKYQPTQKELQDFIHDKNCYSKPFSATQNKKPTHGQLVWVECGKTSVLHDNKPFALLNYLKTEMIKKGYKKENLKIKSIFV